MMPRRPGGRPDGRGSTRSSQRATGSHAPRLQPKMARHSIRNRGVRDESTMVSQFREFLLKTNALALAIGVIIGTALGTVVNSLVNDIIMPPVGVLLGGVDFGS